MKFHDGIVGGVLFVFGLWVALTATSFPQLTGQPIGPGTFPIALGSLCALGGLAIGMMGLRGRGVPLAQIHPGWWQGNRQAAAFVMIAGTAILAATFESVGLPLGGSLLLAALFLVSGKSNPVWIGVAVVFVVSVHLLLTRFLQVPLPAGVLKGMF